MKFILQNKDYLKDLNLTIKFPKEPETEIQCTWDDKNESEGDSIMIVYKCRIDIEEVKKKFRKIDLPHFEQNINEFLSEGENQLEKVLDLIDKKYILLEKYTHKYRGHISGNTFGF